jgi:hypothetical protein
MSPQQAFTIKSPKGLYRAIQTPVGICQPFVGTLTPETQLKCLNFSAIWDTGATGSAITERAAKALGLQPTGLQTVHTAAGKKDKNTYLVNIMLPNNVGVQNVTVTEADLGESIDVLIGMDIITLGDFSITNVGGNTTMSFRVPSIQEIDYVPVANRMNQVLQKRTTAPTYPNNRNRRKKIHNRRGR